MIKPDRIQLTYIKYYIMSCTVYYREYCICLLHVQPDYIKQAVSFTDAV